MSPILRSSKARKPPTAQPVPLTSQGSQFVGFQTQQRAEDFLSPMQRQVAAWSDIQGTLLSPAAAASIRARPPTAANCPTAPPPAASATRSTAHPPPASSAATTAFYPVPSCLYFESQLMTDSLAIRVATVLILVPFSVQSKICKIDSIKY